jgi:putative transport protein
MIAWLVATLQQNAELAIFLALAIGYFVGPLKIAGFNLGNVTACLLAGVLVGPLLTVWGTVIAAIFATKTAV